MAGANTLRIGIADDWDFLRRNYFRRAVARFARDRSLVDLDQLAEINAITQRVLDGGWIGAESIGGELERLRRRRMTQAVDEYIRCAT